MTFALLKNNPFERSDAMNWDQIEGNWKQFKGKIKEKWGELTDGDLDVIAGKQDQLSGKLQERYGWKKEEADRALNDFLTESPTV